MVINLQLKFQKKKVQNILLVILEFALLILAMNLTNRMMLKLLLFAMNRFPLMKLMFMLELLVKLVHARQLVALE